MPEKISVVKCNSLPTGWQWTRLGDILSSVKGKKPKELGLKNKALNVLYINIKAFERNIFEQYTHGDGCEICNKDDILIVWDGARCGLVGKGVVGAVGSTLAKLMHFGLNSAYLYYFLQTKYNEINKRPKGVGIPHIDPNVFWNIEFPLAPLPEQHHIVAKIDELFTKLDAGVEALKKIKAQLKRYRQAVLKYAFEGKLTAEWREKHKEELNSASIFLEQTVKEKMKKGLHKKSQATKFTQLFELPNMWQWTNASIVCSSVRDGTHDTPKYVKNGIPLITSKNLKKYGLDFSTTRNISIEDHEKISLRSGVDKGDILFAMIGTIGNPVIVDTDRTFSIKNVGLFKKDETVINPKYLKYWLESSLFGVILEEKKLLKGTTQRFIPLGHLRILPVPYTLPVEQQKIIDEIELRFSVVDDIEKTINNGLIQADKLRQSILKRAFEGKLVDQDPNDEPAEKLLERIKLEKAKWHNNKNNCLKKMKMKRKK